jgi:hypothetical protein
VFPERIDWKADPNNAPLKPITVIYQTPTRKGGVASDYEKRDLDLEDGGTHLSESTHPNPSQY